MNAQTGSKSNNVSVPRLAPDQVSVAHPTVGDMFKSRTEGGTCVNAQTDSKSNNVSVPNLAPDPMSVAQPAGGDIVKSKMEGGGCVNAQTGSKSSNVIVTNQEADQMSVAQPANGKLSVTRLKSARGAKVSVAELCGKFDEVWQNGCEKCSKLRSVRCVDCVKKMKYGDANGGPSDVRTRFTKWTKPSEFTHTEGGNKWSQRRGYH